MDCLLKPKGRFRRLRRPAHLICVLASWLMLASAASAGEAEYAGKFEPQLAANRENLDQVIFRPVRDLSKLRLAKPLAVGSTVTAARLYHALSDKSAILTLLVEPQGEEPYLYADLNLDQVLEENERFGLKRGEEDNPYLWEATIQEPLKEGLFPAFPLFVQYLRDVQWDEMKEGERLVLESRQAFARGLVEIQGKQTLVQYDYNPRARKITPTLGRIGVDCDGDGAIDLDRFSPEAAEAQEEVVVFRVGGSYVSTKRVDLEKNLIVMRSHPASDYKRIELRVGEEMPDFGFTDFGGKKRRLSEFRGKYLLLDFWGTWCGPCRRELPYLKAAYSRFQARSFEILGLNTDEPEILSQVKSWLQKNELTWPQATRESIKEVIRSLRIHAYPTTLLVGPDGKVMSLNQTKKGQPALRGKELLRSLDALLPL